MKLPSRYLLSFAAILIFIVFNLAMNVAPIHWDLTASRQHSVSDKTKEMLRNLENPVTIRYYASVSENTIPYTLRVYGEKVEYFLDILKQESRGKIEIIRYDPKPGSDAEKTAKFDNITSNFNRDQKGFYFGLSVSCLDQKVKIPFLHPDREGLLEYDILQSIGSVTNRNRKTIGVLSSLPVMGGEYSNDSGTGVFPSWLFINELKKSYNVVLYENDLSILETTPPDLLLVIHPVGFEDNTLRKIDQYLANGGKLIGMLDPYSGAIDMINPSFKKELTSSSFDKMLSAWGVNYIPHEVVADMNLRSEVDRGFGPETMHTVLEISQRYIHKTDPITAGINTLGFPYAGFFWPKPAMAKRIIPLVTTSEAISTVRVDQLFRIGREKNAELMESFQSDGRRRVIVAKLMGQLNSAYPETIRKQELPLDSCQAILFADADFIFDPFAGETVQLSQSQGTIKPYNGNLALLSNAVDHLIGEDTMLAARGKGAVRYPLVGLSDIKLAIEEKYSEQRVEIQKRQKNIEKQLVELSEGQKKNDTTQFIQNKKVINQLLAKRESAEEELNAIEREIDYTLQQSKNRYQWANTFSAPLIVLLIGAIVIYRRNTKSRAR